MTEDGMELNGLYCGRNQKSDTSMQKSGGPSPKPGPRSLTPDSVCVVHVHGWDGNFYENRFVDHAAQVCSRVGIGFVSGNNRGHDYIADILRDTRTVGQGPLRPSQKLEARSQKSEVGAAEGDEGSQKAKAKSQKPKGADRYDYVQIGGIYEELTDCVADIRTWVEFAVGRGARRVILQGHSHGAIKVAHYLLTTRDPRVCGLILLSPSDDMGIGRRDLGNKLFERLLDTAHALMHAGMGRQLLPVKELKYPVSAATFLDCHNKDSITGMFNMSRTDRKEFPELGSIRAPVLLAVGTVEEAFVGAPQKYVQDIQACMANCPSFTGAVIEGAPHNYLGREAQLAGVLEKWLRQRIQGVKESRIRGRV